eukprot:Rmarinus@m.2723
MVKKKEISIDQITRNRKTSRTEQAQRNLEKVQLDIEKNQRRLQQSKERMASTTLFDSDSDSEESEDDEIARGITDLLTDMVKSLNVLQESFWGACGVDSDDDVAPDFRVFLKEKAEDLVSAHETVVSEYRRRYKGSRSEYVQETIEYKTKGDKAFAARDYKRMYERWKKNLEHSTEGLHRGMGGDARRDYEGSQFWRIPTLQ